MENLLKEIQELEVSIGEYETQLEIAKDNLEELEGWKWKWQNCIWDMENIQGEDLGEYLEYKRFVSILQCFKTIKNLKAKGYDTWELDLEYKKALKHIIQLKRESK